MSLNAKDPAFVCGHCGKTTIGVIESRKLRLQPGGQRRRLECTFCGERSTNFTLPEKRYNQLLDSERMLNKILSAIGQPRWEADVQACTNQPDGERHCSDCVHYVEGGCRLGLPDAVDDLFASECNYFTREDEA
jgi:hypothetical protein